MDKQKLITFIQQQFKQDLAAAIEAAQVTLDAATNEESKPENEYDTRGLEASYLAGAQAKRVGQIEEAIYLFEHAKFKDFQNQDKIAVGALVELQANGKNFFVFLMPKGGGQTLKFEGHNIQLITVESPLGEALVGLGVDDVAVVETATNSKEYEIISLQ